MNTVVPNERSILDAERDGNASFTFAGSPPLCLSGLSITWFTVSLPDTVLLLLCAYSPTSFECVCVVIMKNKEDYVKLKGGQASQYFLRKGKKESIIYKF